MEGRAHGGENEQSISKKNTFNKKNKKLLPPSTSLPVSGCVATEKPHDRPVCGSYIKLLSYVDPETFHGDSYSTNKQH